MPFPIALYFIYPVMNTSDNLYVEIDYSELILHLQSFLCKSSLFDLIQNFKPFVFLEGFFAKYECKNLQIFKRDLHKNQINDGLKIYYKELYFCTPRNEFMIENYPKIKRPHIRFYIFCNKAITLQKKIDYFETLGKIIVISEKILFINVRIMNVYVLLMNSKPDFIRNGVIYQLKFWPKLNELICSLFTDFKPISFISYFYESISLESYDIIIDKSDYYSIMLKQLNPNGNIHWLNSNLNYCFCYMEGSLEQVDLFLSL
jgi:hypothetical protein